MIGDLEGERSVSQSRSVVSRMNERMLYQHSITPLCVYTLLRTLDSQRGSLHTPRKMMGWRKGPRSFGHVRAAAWPPDKGVFLGKRPSAQHINRSDFWRSCIHLYHLHQHHSRSDTRPHISFTMNTNPSTQYQPARPSPLGMGADGVDNQAPRVETAAQGGSGEYPHRFSPFVHRSQARPLPSS